MFPGIAAAAKPRDGYWTASVSDVSGPRSIKLRVAHHRVVAVVLDVSPTAGPTPDYVCGRQVYGFVGPFEGPNRSTRKSFFVNSAEGFEIAGTFYGATRLEGYVRIFPGTSYACSMKDAYFSATFMGKH